MLPILFSSEMCSLNYKKKKKMEMGQCKSRLTAGQDGIAGDIAYQEDIEELIVKELRAESALLHFGLCR